MQQLEAQLSPEQRAAVAACGITNQRETTVLWRSADCQPCGPALVWQDRRTASICRQWREQPGAESWQQRTGLVLDPYFSASKVQWLLENNAEAADAKAAGTLRFGTVDSWLLWQLTNGSVHATDLSKASRTLLLDLDHGCWLPEACERVGLTESALPELKPCRSQFGSIAAGLPFAGCRSQPCWGTSRRPVLASSAWNLAKPNAPMEQVRFWSSMWAQRLCEHPVACSAPWAGPRPMGASPIALKAASSMPAPLCNGCAMAWG